MKARIVVLAVGGERSAYYVTPDLSYKREGAGEGRR